MNINQMELLVNLEDHLIKYNLTSRELEIIRLWIRDFSYKEIAIALGVSDTTVRKHIHNINIKLGVHSKLEILLMLIEKIST